MASVYRELRGLTEAFVIERLYGLKIRTTIKTNVKSRIRSKIKPKTEVGVGEVVEGGSKIIFNFTPELEAHIKYVDPSVPRKQGIGGAHNSKEFFKSDVEIVSETPSKIPGVKTVEYRMSKLNADGTPANGYFEDGEITSFFPDE